MILPLTGLCLKSTRKLTFLTAILVFLCLGCATSVKKVPAGLVEKKVATPMPLRLSNQLPKEFNFVQVNTFTKIFEDDQIAQEKLSRVDFILSVEKSGAPGQDILNWQLQTISKDGMMNLHDFAYPELEETLKLVIKNNGEVIIADEKPKDSVFYVPIISLPDGPIQVGETWTLKTQWIAASGLPLELEMVSTLENFYSCLEFPVDTCALIDVSGRVSIVGMDDKQIKFQSQSRGKILFNVEKGLIERVKMFSRDKVVGIDKVVETVSCNTLQIAQTDKRESLAPNSLLKCDYNNSNQDVITLF